MKKTLFIVMAVFITFSASAQKMKIKKGEIQIDGASIAKIVKQKGSNDFLFSDLNGIPLFTVSEEMKTPSGIILPHAVLLFTGTNGNVQEISTKEIKWSFTFNKEDYMTQLVFNSGADLITMQGVNMDKINEFFQISSRSVTDAFIATLEQAKAGLAQEEELANSVNLTVNRKGDILANGKKIGNISKEETQERNVYIYRISEYNNIPIASMTAAATTNPSFYETVTYDGKTFPVFSEKGFSFLFDSDDNAKRVVRKLYYEGYKLGNMKEFFEEKKKAEEEALIAEKEALIAMSGNIYQKQGYVIDKKGNKIEGLITLEFMSKGEALGESEDSIEELNTYGQQVLIRTKEDDVLENWDGTVTVLQKNEFTHYAKDGVKVVVDNIQYLGVAGSFMGRGAFFYKIIYEKDGNMVLREHKFDTVMLMLANQKKPTKLNYVTLLGDKNSDKIQKEFDEYVNCPALTYSNYVTNTVEGLIKLVDDYVEKCK